MNRARKAIESRYKASCNVYEYVAIKDPITKITSKSENLVLENQPCKLSNESTTVIADGVPVQSMSTKLFISPDITIKAGSKIVVTQHEVTTEYAQSSSPMIFTNHQEIMLKLFEKYA